MPSSEGFCRRERNPACVGFWSRSRIDSWCAALQRIGKQIQHGQLVWRRRPLPLRHVGVEDLRPEPTFGERFLDDGSSDGLPVAERTISWKPFRVNGGIFAMSFPMSQPSYSASLTSPARIFLA